MTGIFDSLDITITQDSGSLRDRRIPCCNEEEKFWQSGTKSGTADCNKTGPGIRVKNSCFNKAGQKLQRNNYIIRKNNVLLSIISKRVSASECLIKKNQISNLIRYITKIYAMRFEKLASDKYQSFLNLKSMYLTERILIKQSGLRWKIININKNRNGIAVHPIEPSNELEYLHNEQEKFYQNEAGDAKK
ncbi:MAG: hypothetical protein LBK61_03680 [Spirochaetaceae bacterium]|jgi:hypothetical protein|nr:hypothetical protein [Spirochaetaceae bacterium]